MFSVSTLVTADATIPVEPIIPNQQHNHLSE